MDEFDVDCWLSSIVNGLVIAHARAVVHGVWLELVAILLSIYGSLRLWQRLVFWFLVTIIIASRLLVFINLVKLCWYGPEPIVIYIRYIDTDYPGYVCQIVYLLTSLTPRLIDILYLEILC